jgi:hypothetical protein
MHLARNIFFRPPWNSGTRVSCLRHTNRMTDRRQPQTDDAIFGIFQLGVVRWRKLNLRSDKSKRVYV